MLYLCAVGRFRRLLSRELNQLGLLQKKREKAEGKSFERLSEEEAELRRTSAIFPSSPRALVKKE